jgi:tripartite-type tricarboxylate transporter receptor subunit TctC
MTSRRQFIAAGSAGAALVASGLPVIARATAPVPVPEQLTRFVVGFAPGGGTDTIARMLADSVRDAFPKGLLVENKPGASSRMAVKIVKDAPADGSMMLVTPDFALTVYPHSFRDLGYDPLKDLVPVATVALAGLALCVGPAVPESVKTPVEFLDWCKANPKQANFGSPGSGSSFHFAGLLLGEAHGVKLTHIGYKGGAPALQDVMGGQIAANVCAVGEAFTFAQAGKLRIIGTFGTERDEFAPEAPTMVESGFKDVVAYAWVGVLAPAKTPAAVVARTASVINEATASGVLTERLAKYSMRPLTRTSEEFGKMIAEDIARWEPVVKASGFTADD